MASLVIVGAQWGDEGKGKIVDYFGANADYIVRFQGGNNAGHTLVVDGVKTKLSLVPSGILHPKTVCCIGAGTVVNPQVLISEIEMLRKSGHSVTPERLIIDRDAHVILDYHVAIDLAREEQLGAQKIGTTGRGIGPAYEDRAARVGVRVAELGALAELKPRLAELVKFKANYLKNVLASSTELSLDKIMTQLEAAAKILVPFIGNVSLTLDKARRDGKRVVFEGAQGTLLDQAYGSVPFVTSSHTLAGAAATGAGVGPRTLDCVMAIAKAYSTRVGSGPFPTELTEATGDRLRERGGEFGTVTGRPRRCGWFDAVALRRALRLNGADCVGVTKLDVLSGFESLKICTEYRLDGKVIEDFPALLSEYERVKPTYLEMPGWKEDLTGITKWDSLPKAAQSFVKTLEELIGSTVAMVSVGAERNATIMVGENQSLRKFL